MPRLAKEERARKDDEDEGGESEGDRCSGLTPWLRRYILQTWRWFAKHARDRGAATRKIPLPTYCPKGNVYTPHNMLRYRERAVVPSEADCHISRGDVTHYTKR
jgi:hypothetical protein